MGQNKRLMSINLSDYFLKTMKLVLYEDKLKKTQDYGIYSPTARIFKKCP